MVEHRVCQGIVDDAAAICGALVAELRLRGDLLDGNGAGPEQLVQAAVGGALATPRARREVTARGLQELVSSGALADSAAVDRSVHLARCPPQVAHALDLGGLAPSELWCADVPLSVESDAAGMLRLVLDREPRRSLLRALRGVGHEASLQLAQERGRQRAVADLARARQNLGTLAAAAARLRRETERRDVLHAIADELRKLGFESALLLAGPEGVTLAHMSHKRAVIDEAMKLIGIRRMSELLPIDPAKSPLLDTLLKSPEPVVEVRSHQLLRAIWGRRASEPARERLIDLLRLSHVVAAPLRGAGDHALGILLANVSHELRSPLVTMIGYTELLLAEKMGQVNERQRQCLQVARSSGKRLRMFIEELLDFSRFELTRESMTFQPFDLREAVTQ